MDIRTVYDSTNNRFDWLLAGGDVASGADLETAVIISLFSDRRAPDNFPAADLRGWWGDTYSKIGPTGSRLWTLRRAIKIDASTLLIQAQDYCLEALTWLQTLGVIASVTVQASWLTSDAIGLAVNITEPDGSLAQINYSWAWQGVGQ